jgi:hypothetical protein
MNCRNISPGTTNLSLAVREVVVGLVAAAAVLGLRAYVVGFLSGMRVSTPTSAGGAKDGGPDG